MVNWTIWVTRLARLRPSSPKLSRYSRSLHCSPRLPLDDCLTALELPPSYISVDIEAPVATHFSHHMASKPI
ncbi:TPA: hypothetical protein EYP26_00800 [Candidatus Bathyarchaeota archaeon]|nr:hypothetical protein [Candidatus Bathyarchaeota archaeon]